MSDHTGSADDGGQGPLVCPGCARVYPRTERFCPSCDMPLVYGETEGVGKDPASERQRRARKIKPQYSEGALVKVAHVQTQPEAELIEAMLLDEGIPCLLSNSIAGYAPLAGSRDVMVPESGAQAAREALIPQRPETSPQQP